MGETVGFGVDPAAEGYLAEPDAPDAQTRGVVVIQEWWGLDDHIRSVTDRFADAGFVALAPDLYHGTVASSPDEAEKLRMTLDIDRAGSELRQAVVNVKERTGHAPGVVGFCMGGALSLYAACASGDDVGACVIYYGGYPGIEYDYAGLTAPVLGHWAEHDDLANPSVGRLEDAFAAHVKPYEFHRYTGTHHAFFNDSRPAVYDLDAAGQSWQRTLRFFRDHLH